VFAPYQGTGHVHVTGVQTIRGKHAPFIPILHRILVCDFPPCISRRHTLSQPIKAVCTTGDYMQAAKYAGLTPNLVKLDAFCCKNAQEPRQAAAGESSSAQVWNSKNDHQRYLSAARVSFTTALSAAVSSCSSAAHTAIMKLLFTHQRGTSGQGTRLQVRPLAAAE
jgi:hypothetical protein